MEERPSKIGEFTLGAETTSSSKTIATSLFLSFAQRVVNCPHAVAPVGFIAKEISKSPEPFSRGIAFASVTTSPFNAGPSLPAVFFKAYNS